tara:strand:- start:264 stop:1826 length:1563 start_codon:yes stop_codon:yes gene_type:complete
MTIYSTGSGSIRQRAVWDREDDSIVITALPYQVSGERVLEQIASQISEKKLPMVLDVRDESDHENLTRLVIVPRSNRIDHFKLMDHLFATTSLENSYRINMNMIGLDGRPRVHNLKDVLIDWLTFRRNTVTRRLTYQTERLEFRLDILSGLLKAYSKLDEIIRVIREEEIPKSVLIKKFRLKENQAEAILEMKLRQLAKLEEVRIRKEQKDLSKELKSIQTVLKSKVRLNELVRNELLADAEEFGDARYSPLVEREAAKSLTQNELISSDPITVVLSEKGWIRGARSHDVDARKLNYRSGDKYLHEVSGRTNEILLCIDSTGRTYPLMAHALSSARSQGEPVSSQLRPPASSIFRGVMIGQEGVLYLISTDSGFGFIANIGDMNTRNKSGKLVLNAKGANILPPQRIQELENNLVGVISSTGRLLIFSANELPKMARGKGVKLLNIPNAKYKNGDEKVLDIVVFSKNERLRIIAGRQHMTLKPTDYAPYIGSRAQRGRMLPRGYKSPDAIIVEEPKNLKI